MNAMLKVFLAAIIVASMATTTLAGGGSVGRQYYPTQSYYPAQSYVVAQPQVETRQAYSYEPGVTFKAGDMAVVGKAVSDLKIGTQVLATIPQGTRISVITVQDNWVGTSIDRNGQKVSGWVWGSDLAASAAPVTVPAASK